MPTVTLSKKEVEKLMGKRLGDEELKDRISMIGTDLEKIEGDEIVVEIFPNRPDMLSEAGFARALSAFIGVKTGLRNYVAKKGGLDYKVTIDKSVDKVRPHTACAIVKNLKFDDEKIRELIQLQEKLHVTFGRNRKKLAIGVYPLEQISLPIKYSAREPSKIRFRPLESDVEMTGHEILEKHPTGREYAHLLEGKSVFPLFEDSAGEVLSVPPIINSHKTGRVTDETSEVFIECSGFDFSVLSQCLNIIVTSLADIGGEVYEMTLERVGEKKVTPELKPREWPLDTPYINKMVGFNLKETEIKALLEKMGYGVKAKKVLVPCYRTDILHQIDLAEDVAIAYGYENFEPLIPDVSTIAQESPIEVFKSRIASIMVGLGFLETMSYHLTNKESELKLMLKAKQVELANSLTSDRSILRSSLLPGLMQIFSENTSREYPQRIFEMGIVFSHSEKTDTKVEERPKLAIAICEGEADFTHAKQVLDALFSGLALEYKLEPIDNPSFIEGRSAKIVCKKDIGIIGEVSAQAISSFGVMMPVSAIEIDLEELHRVSE